ncbi:MAG: class I SAM-dependent methyltransferase [Chthoniobacterales bacterium]|nr:class I SAM-dependent methyltransferase [Chthoniobacterales bacterium]
MKIARQYGYDYWDGDRKYGYGGYSYIPGRWKSVAENLIKDYQLADGMNILEIGCGKGFLLYEMQLLMPSLNLYGLDISEYAIKNAHPKLKATFFVGNANDLHIFNDKMFNLIISINTLHNLPLHEIERSLNEIDRVGDKAYIVVESFRNEQELFNLQCWALTAESFFRPETWIYLFNKKSINIDYEFIFFE